MIWALPTIHLSLNYVSIYTHYFISRLSFTIQFYRGRNLTKPTTSSYYERAKNKIGKKYVQKEIIISVKPGTSRDVNFSEK